MTLPSVLYGLSAILDRKRPEWDVTRLAAAIGRDRRTVGRWRTLKDDPQVGDAIKIADLLGVTLDELAGRVAPEAAAREAVAVLEESATTGPDRLPEQKLDQPEKRRRGGRTKSA